MAQVLLVTSGWIHPPYGGRVALRQTLASLEGLSFDDVSSLEEALRLPPSRYAAMVLYYHHPSSRLTDREVDTLRSYVEAGGGLLAIHSATASYKSTAPYFEILGGRFTGHGPVQPIELRPTQSDDPVFGGIAPFTITDELYLHQLEADLTVRFDAEHDGQTVPVVWTREPGEGRVCYVGPGHRAESLRHPSLQELLKRALTWVGKLG